jgi:hypothetical protein
VLLMTWPKKSAGEMFSPQPTILGISSAALFGLSAVGFRGAITALGQRQLRGRCLDHAGHRPPDADA